MKGVQKMYQKLIKNLRKKKIQMIQRKRINNFKKRIIKAQKHKEKMRKNSSLVSST